MVSLLAAPWRSFEARPLLPARWSPNTRSRIVRAATVNQDSSKLAVLLEVDGVLADVHRHGHRQSFNLAFQKLGLDCANWSEPVYADLQRQSAGEEEQMLKVFFDRIGWPMSLPTNEKDAFVRKLMQSKQLELEGLVSTAKLPLRPGLIDFVDEATRGAIPIIVLAAYSKSGEHFSRLLVDKLGSERASYIKVVGQHEVENSFYGQVVLGKGVSSSPEELLAEEAAKAVASEKQRLAKQVASALKLTVEIDTTSRAELKRVVAALRAGAECADVPVDRCILLAGGQLGTEAANEIGMLCVTVRSSLTARAEFPLARGSFEGLGVGDIARLQKYFGHSQ